MKKLFIFLCLSAFSVAFAQSKKTKFVNLSKETLYKMFSNSAAAKEIYNNESEKEKKERFKKYYCMIKTYKSDFSEDSNFTSQEEANKKLDEIFSSPDSVKPQTNAVEFLDTIYHLQMGSAQSREDFYDTHKKCLIKDEYYWSPQENQ